MAKNIYIVAMNTSEKPRPADEELVRQFQLGAEQSFDQLMQRHQEMVLRVCLRLLHNEADARDAAQEVFIKVYRSLSGYRPQARFTTWLYRIVLNHCANVLRSRRRRRWLMVFADEARRVELQQTKEVADNPGQLLERNERVAQVRRALAQLPEEQAIAIVLHRYEGLSYQAIADITHSSVQAVESRLHRAKKKLARLLVEPLSGE